MTGERYADALAEAQRWAETSGAMSVHAFDQRETILGQGTLALELAGQVGEAGHGAGAGRRRRADRRHRVLVRGHGPRHRGRAGRRADADLRSGGGRPADAPAGGVAADALAPRRVGELVFPITQAYVEDVVLVGDAAILAAQQALWQATRIAAEPAASVGIAALLTGAYKPAAGEHVAVVISGANMSPSVLESQLG